MIADTLANEIGAGILILLLTIGFIYVLSIIVDIVFDIYRGFKFILKEKIKDERKH